MKPRAVEIHIERLVLDGHPHTDGPAMAAAIQRALADRFIEAPHAPEARGAILAADVTAPASPARIAASIADALAGETR